MNDLTSDVKFYWKLHFHYKTKKDTCTAHKKTLHCVLTRTNGCLPPSNQGTLTTGKARQSPFRSRIIGINVIRQE